MEFIIRGKGFLGTDQDANETMQEIESTVVETRDGIPIRIRDLGSVRLGLIFGGEPFDLNGAEAVGGVVVMRYGENAGCDRTIERSDSGN
ncbi:MAG: hypothetical protein R3C11_29330 [Planctomycetaceae bacterium]